MLNLLHRSLQHVFVVIGRSLVKATLSVLIFCAHLSKSIPLLCSLCLVLSGWYDLVLLPLENHIRLGFKEGDVAVLSTPKPGSGMDFVYCEIGHGYILFLLVLLQLA